MVNYCNFSHSIFSSDPRLYRVILRMHNKQNKETDVLTVGVESMFYVSKINHVSACVERKSGFYSLLPQSMLYRLHITFFGPES